MLVLETLTLVGVGHTVGPLLIMLGSLGFDGIFGIVRSIQSVPSAVLLGTAAAGSVGGNAPWLSGRPIYAWVPWWIGVLVFSRAGSLWTEAVYSSILP